jgi:hypothetical protein
VAALNLVFWVALVVTLLDVAAINPNMLLFGPPSAARRWFLLPWVGAVLTPIVVAMAIAAWLRTWWPLAGQIYYALVTGAALGFIGLLIYWGLLRL